MSFCRRCNQIDNPGRRYFSDHKKDPFVVVLDRVGVSPVLMTREHKVLCESERTSALMRLKNIARRVFGKSVYVMRSYERSNHWCVIAQKVKANSKIPSMSVVELKDKLVGMGRMEEWA